MSIQVTNAGPDADTSMCCPRRGFATPGPGRSTRRSPRCPLVGAATVDIQHPFLGDLELLAGPTPGGESPTLLFCENETNHGRLYGIASSPPYAKDGINDHVVAGTPTVNPEQRGTKCAAWYRRRSHPAPTVELRLRLRPRGRHAEARRPSVPTSRRPMTRRRAEADEFYAELTPADASPDEAMVMRQAFAGMLWSKQLYYFDVARWLDGDPTQPRPPVSRLSGRNARWRNFDAFDIMSMPDKWEYPWFAAWDLAFHCVALAHVDPAFAKYQLILLCREWFQHPNGALPPTSGTSGTSTPRSRPGPPWKSSPSMAAAMSTS